MFKKNTVPIKVLKQFLDLIEYLERNKQKIIFDNQLLADVSIKCKLPNKSIFYLQQIIQTNPQSAAQQLIGQYIKLNNYNSAHAIYVKYQGFIDLKINRSLPFNFNQPINN